MPVAQVDHSPEHIPQGDFLHRPIMLFLNLGLFRIRQLLQIDLLPTLQVRRVPTRKNLHCLVPCVSGLHTHQGTIRLQHKDKKEATGKLPMASLT